MKKDGPSASITIVSGFLSFALNRAIRQNVATTGAISPMGNVLPVFSIEKRFKASFHFQARMTDANCLISPENNRTDFEEPAEYIKDDIMLMITRPSAPLFPLV